MATDFHSSILQQAARDNALLWRGVLVKVAEVESPGMEKESAPWPPPVAYVQARYVFGDNLELLLLLENVLRQQTEWRLRCPGREVRTSRAGGAPHDHAVVADQCKKAERKKTLAMCLLFPEVAGERGGDGAGAQELDWLDIELSNGYYSLELPADAAFGAAVLPSRSHLAQELLLGCAEPVLACWLR